MKYAVLNGADLLDSQYAKTLLNGKKLGLVTNVSGVTKNLTRTAVKLAEKYNLCALFSPEHGLSSVRQAGGYDDEVYFDKDLNIPVYDLFGRKESMVFAETVFRNLDAVVFDIQDIGVRYFTYQYTMLDTMKLCSDVSIPFIILDRINPLGGARVEGNLLTSDCVSSVGRVEGQAVVSGMTIGELALWYNDYLNIGAHVEVISCDGWKRSMEFDDTDLLFVPPSPNMPTTDTVFLYSGTCLFEGTNISEGRGTTKPFEMFGAPWIDSKELIMYLNSLPADMKEYFDGLVFRPCSYQPWFSDYQGVVCNGLQLHIKNKNDIDMFSTVCILIYSLRNLYPHVFKTEPFFYNLFGCNEWFDDIDSLRKLLDRFKTEREYFHRQRKDYLLYS